MTRLPTPMVKRHQSGDLHSGDRETGREARLRRREQRRQKHQGDHGEQILDDEPSDRDVSGWRV